MILNQIISTFFWFKWVPADAILVSQLIGQSLRKQVHFATWNLSVEEGAQEGDAFLNFSVHFCDLAGCCWVEMGTVEKLFGCASQVGQK